MFNLDTFISESESGKASEEKFEQSFLLSRQLRILTLAVIGRTATVRNCHGTVSENGTTAVVGLVHRKNSKF